ncbi:MAG: ATP-binding protein [Candidatus Caldarchaeum sp.]
MTYFSPGPKTDRRDLYDREKELSQLVDALRGRDRLIVVTGIRRIGKTSLIRVAVKESKLPCVYLDLRRLEAYSDAALLSLLSDELNSFIPLHKRLAGYLKSVRGVSVEGLYVSLSLKPPKPSLAKLLDEMDRWAEKENQPLVIALDEAQELRFFKGRYNFAKIIAYSYDSHRAVKFLVSGSEVGVLYSTLGLNDARSPLYGRYRKVIQLERFSPDLARDFLVEGFKQEGVVERAVDVFDGVVGWLAFYGSEVADRVRRGEEISESVLDAVVDEAVETVRQELLKLKSLSRLYIPVLKSLSTGDKTWSQVRSSVEQGLGRTVAKAQLSRALRNLENLSYIQRVDGRYVLLDRLTGVAVRDMR